MARPQRLEVHRSTEENKQRMLQALFDNPGWYKTTLKHKTIPHVGTSITARVYADGYFKALFEQLTESGDIVYRPRFPLGIRCPKTGAILKIKQPDKKLDK